MGAVLAMLLAAGLLAHLVSSFLRRSAPAPIVAPAPANVFHLNPYAIEGAQGDPRWSREALAHAHDLIAPLANAGGMPAKSGLILLAADGQVLYARNAAAPLVPASTMKLLAGSAAYFGLGAGYRFHTKLVATSPPDARGVVHGDLHLVGSGDPLLTADDLNTAAAQLRRRGVHRIDGDLVVDATAFAGAEQNPTWLPSDLEYDYAAGASAVSLDQGLVQIDVTPTSPGEPAKVAMTPQNDAVRISGQATTTSSTMSLSIERSADGRGLVISGGIPAGPKQSFWRTVVGEPDFVGDVFARVLRAGGIAVEGVRLAATPTAGGTVLWDHASQRLGELVRGMFFESNNHTAEQLLRVVGRDGGVPGTVESGREAERRLFAAAGVQLGEAQVVDGSGLSPRDRIGAATLARLLRLDLSARGGAAFVKTLPRAGMEGTVRLRTLDQARGMVRAKDGYEDGASSLAGYVQTRHHGTVCFAFIADDWDSLDRVWQLEDEILDRVSTL
ncbi:MAG: D-alanyl-D-alanine carboxypeptidase/D-alanyl-D-alanine-endopeptidase [bacterium]|nr:D-alanyl-D-alanine carboxypeptidase/D-alanyl-D-alanine-endopeptidase [bacterium]